MTTPASRLLRAITALSATATLGLSAARAATYTWEGAVTGPGPLDWSLDSNWSGTGTPNAAGDVANLTANWTLVPQFTLISPTTTLGILNINDTGAPTDSNTQINSGGGTLVFDNGLSNAQLNTDGATNSIDSVIQLNSNLTINNASSVVINSSINGAGGLTKTGTGTLTIGGSTPAFAGNVDIQQGTLSVNPNQRRLPSTASINIASGATLSLTFPDVNSTFAGLTGAGTLSLGGTNAKLITINNAVANTFTGSITQANGGTNILIKSNAGDFTLSGAGSWSASASATSNTLTLNGGRFIYDNSASNVDRINNATVLLNTRGGELSIIGNAGNATNETLGALTVNTSRGSKITLAPGSGQSSTLTLASYAVTVGVDTSDSRSTDGGVLFRGTGLGTAAPGTANVSNVIFTAALTLIGGGGAAGTTTISILPSALGDTSATGLGAGLVTYNATNGIRLIDTTTEVAAYGAATNTNQKITAGGGITGQVVNSLLVDNGTGSAMTSTISGGTLGITSNALVFSGANKSTIAGTAINFAADSSAYISVLSGATAEMAGATFTTATSNGLVKQGAGTLILTGQVAGNSGYVVAAGTLRAGATNALLRNISSVGTVLTVQNGATADMAGFAQTAPSNGQIFIEQGGILTNTGANALFTVNGNNITRNSIIDGTITDGDGGDATTGRVSLNVGGAGGDIGNLYLTHGGHTLGSISFGATGTATDTLNMTSISSTDSNTISGTVTAALRQRINIDTTANKGTNAVAQTLGTATVVLDASAAASTGLGPLLSISSRSEGGSANDNELTSANTLAWTNNVSVTNTSSGRFAGITVGASAANAPTNSYLNLAADNLSNGVTQQLGALSVAGGSTTLQVSANNGYTLEFTGATTLTHTAATTQTLEVAAGTLALNAVGESGTGSKGLTKTGAGTLVIKGDAIHTGLTTVTAGSLNIGAGSTTGSISGNITNNAAVVFNRSNDSTYSGVMNGNGTLTKQGAGLLTLSGNNTYSGGTTVTLGTLKAGSSAAFGTGGVTINGGKLDVGSFALNNAITLTAGTVTGTGTLNADLALNSLSDVLSPGNSPGILSLGVAQTWSSFTYDWEVNDFDGTVAGTSFDQIAIAGGLTLSGSSNSIQLNVIGLDALNATGIVPDFSEINRSWTIVSSDTAISGFDAAHWDINTTSFGSPFTGTWTVELNDTDIDLVYTTAAIPEPSGYATLAGVGMIGFALYRRRRSAK